ncbi:hypothetical protein MP228_005661 [Amoeboaphelidium protococcarum]|nr:hypothetical protein MP228_005661 [Amoeboaphelidium protococcarum]
MQYKSIAVIAALILSTLISNVGALSYAVPRPQYFQMGNTFGDIGQFAFDSNSDIVVALETQATATIPLRYKPFNSSVFNAIAFSNKTGTTYGLVLARFTGVEGWFKSSSAISCVISSGCNVFYSSFAVNADDSVMLSGQFRAQPIMLFDAQRKGVAVLNPQYNNVSCAVAAHFDANGAYVWSMQVCGFNGASVTFVGVDAYGNRIIGGNSQSTMLYFTDDKNALMFQFPLKLVAGANYQDSFIVSLSPVDNSIQWSIIGHQNACIQSNLAGAFTPSRDKLNIRGTFCGPAYFYDKDNNVLAQTGYTGVWDQYVINLSTQFGQFNWIITRGGEGAEFGVAIQVDENENVYIGGNSGSQNQVIIDTTGTRHVISYGKVLFAGAQIKLDKFGKLSHHAFWNGNSSSVKQGAYVGGMSDSYGNFYVYGQYKDPVDLYDKKLRLVSSYNMSSSNSALFAMFDSNGNSQWNTELEGATYSRSIFTTNMTVYLGVGFISTLRVLDSGRNFQFQVASNGGEDFAIIKYDVFYDPDITSTVVLAAKTASITAQFTDQASFGTDLSQSATSTIALSTVNSLTVFSSSTPVSAESTSSASYDSNFGQPDFFGDYFQSFSFPPAQTVEFVPFIFKLQSQFSSGKMITTSFTSSNRGVGDIAANSDGNFSRLFPVLISLAACVVIIISLFCGVWIYRMRRARWQKAKKHATQQREQDETQMQLQTVLNFSTMANNTTLLNQSDVISVPAFLELTAGLHFRSNEKNPLAAGGQGKICKAEVLKFPASHLYKGTSVPVCVAKYYDKNSKAEAFLQEVALLWYFREERSIARIIGFDSSNKILLMPFYELGSLNGLISDAMEGDASKLSFWSMNFDINAGLDIFRGLTALHAAGIIHNDVKSANYLLQVVNQQIVFCLTDFGICTLMTQSSKVTGMQWNSLKGVTVHYAAPEFFEQSALPEQLHPARDVYAASIVLNEIYSQCHAWQNCSLLQIKQFVLMGQRPETRRLQYVNAHAPALETVIQSGWRQNPADRASAAQMVKSLESLLSTEMIQN